jgi:hypothetical protein
LPRSASDWFAITPYLEQGDHVGRRQFSSVLLIVPSLLAIGLSFVHQRGALWALALNFAAPVIRKWSKPAGASRLNRTYGFTDYCN